MSESLRSLLSRIRRLKWPIRGSKSTSVAYFLAVTACAVLTYYIAFALRFEFEVPDSWERVRDKSLLWLVPLQLVCLYASGALSPLVARMRWPDALRITAGIGISTLLLLFLWYHFNGAKTPPRSVILLQGVLTLFAVALLQSATPHLYHIFRGEFGRRATAGRIRGRVIIIGTGYVAYWLARQLNEEAAGRRRAVGLVRAPEEPLYPGRFLADVPVIGHLDGLEFLVRRYDADRILIGVPTLSPEHIQHVVDVGRKLRVSVRIVPPPQEMLFGQVQVSEARAVSLEDVLGRNVLDSDTPQIHQLVSGKRILVTGAAGSIGTELCRQILAYGPEKLYVLDNSEPALYALQQKLTASPTGANAVQPLLYSVRNTQHMRQLLEKIRPQIIFHSAALKHVPMMEMFPAEGLLTNTLATVNLARIAAEVGTEKFVFISTDKAIRPTNAMGASKRLAELLLLDTQQRATHSGHKLEIISVRFGNVLRSTGSVIPLFEKQIYAGGPVTVTDPEVMRYFMSIPEAVWLVLQSATMSRGGDIFLLDMGEPIKIIDMAHRLISLYGLEPERDIPIRIIGLRPGEKLFEELSYDSETHQNTSHPRIWRLRPAAAAALAPTPADSALRQADDTSAHRATNTRTADTPVSNSSDTPVNNLSDPPASNSTDIPASCYTGTLPQATPSDGIELEAALLRLIEDDSGSDPAVIKRRIAKLLPDYQPDYR